MEMLQKAVMPGRVRQWLTTGDDLLAGFAVRADDVAWAATPAQLVEAHGLAFPGSPYSTQSRFVDVLRFPATPFTSFEDAVGGTTRAAADAIGGPFVDHPPFTGTGFVACSAVVPLWWVAPTRVPPTSRLVRVRADGSSTVIAVYVHVGLGWQYAPGVDGEMKGRIPPSLLLGASVEYRGERMSADLLPDGRVIVASTTPHDGMEQSSTGIWWAAIPASEAGFLSALRLDATWQELRFRVTRRSFDDGVETAALVYIGHDALAGEAAGLVKTDQGVYEAAVPWAELTDPTATEASIAREPGRSARE